MHSVPFPIGWKKQFIALLELLFAFVELQGFFVWKSLYAVSQGVNFSEYWLLCTSFLLWAHRCKVVPSAFWKEHMALHRNSWSFIPQVLKDGSQRKCLDALIKECEMITKWFRLRNSSQVWNWSMKISSSKWLSFIPQSSRPAEILVPCCWDGNTGTTRIKPFLVLPVFHCSSKYLCD